MAGLMTEEQVTIAPEQEATFFSDVKDAVAKDLNLGLNAASTVLSIPFHILSWPISLFTWFVLTYKKHAYNPEKVRCPGCGFRGDAGTNGKTCRIKHEKVDSAEKAVNEHTCFRCSAVFYSKLFLPAKQWMKF